MRTTQLDLFDADQPPDLRGLRAESPVHHDPATGLWLVSRHADVRAVLADPEAFHPDNALTAITPVPRPVLRVLARAGFSLPPTLANNGTPTHTALRRLVAGFLTPARVASFADRIADLCAERLVDGPVDLHASLARDLPCVVLMEVLGIRDVDVPALKAWSTASLELFWGNPSVDRQHELAASAGEFHRWLTTRLRAASPAGDDLFGALVARGTPVREAAGLCYFLLIAGQETTTQLLSTLLDRVLRHPDVWHRLSLDEPGLAAACVEEVLRREPPVTTWRRLTSRPVELSGVRLPAGAPLLLMLTGTDPEVFADPESFCPGRPDARKHLAFGYGRHFCLGAGLARLEGEVVLRTVARRFPALRLASVEPPPMLNLLSFRAPLSVPVV
ncbi:cytochrome P450 [Umezawaea tangerina]|uniref:Cytochrome P450 n=1 Tax=Umezawaea tangerina TaxID=84725 RepID=A0A2T0TA95_9PSEU|nr:cytochrome P450 [Umezawaea tangerina]PRY42592.1 cytochrome P450 [Umezawaea tangerina]